MANVLLVTWTPDKWQWTNLTEQRALTLAGQRVEHEWKCHTAHARIGDKAFIVMQGGQHGVMASGTVLTDPRWVDDPDGPLGPAQRVRLSLDVILDPAQDETITVDELMQHVDPRRRYWGVGHSGSIATPEIGERLVARWDALLSRRNIQPATVADSVTLPEEVVPGFFEGTPTQIIVNVYERNPKARVECIKHYGAKCRVCGFDFAERYGALGEGFIHVHHTRQIADVGGEYEVNPIADLVPVCPNCHAMLHRSRPPMEISELRDQLLPR